MPDVIAKFVSNVWKSGKRYSIPIPKEQVNILKALNEEGAQIVVAVYRADELLKLMLESDVSL